MVIFGFALNHSVKKDRFSWSAYASFAHSNITAGMCQGLAVVPTYKCCSFRGSVVSLDATTGEKLWQSYPIQTPPQATDDKTQGPSGAAIWSAPTIDLAGKRLFVTTGDAYSSPADKATDAVVGMDLLDGHLLWVNQGSANDVWTAACLSPTAAKACGPDQDYGSPAMLVSANNQPFLVAGQKSGWIRAVGSIEIPKCLSHR
jgi:polyvinyl alcohol dehydrogenase (cytochrome)